MILCCLLVEMKLDNFILVLVVIHLEPGGVVYLICLGIDVSFQNFRRYGYRGSLPKRVHRNALGYQVWRLINIYIRKSYPKIGFSIYQLTFVLSFSSSRVI